MGKMTAAEQPQTPLSPSFLRRSTSIFKRLSRRESRSAMQPMDPPLSPFSPFFAPSNLQRRSTKENLPRPIITHLQTIEVSQSSPTSRTTQRSIITSRRRVLASDMRTQPFPSSPHVQTVAWNVFLTPEQAYSLVMGCRPKETDDKWFIFAEGPDHSGKLKVHFHRSWTGMKIAELFILIDLKGEGAGKIVGIKWDGSDQTNGLDKEEVKYMVSTACVFALDVNLEDGVL